LRSVLFVFLVVSENPRFNIFNGDSVIIDCGTSEAICF